MVDDKDRNLTRTRRVDILACAEKEFAAAGFAGARIDRIAAAAHVNKQLLFHYFGSKQGLFTAAVAATLSRLDSERQESGSPVEQLRGLAKNLAVAASRWPGLTRIALETAADPSVVPAAAAQVREWRNRMDERIRRAVLDGQRRGYFRDDVDPQFIAEVALSGAAGRVGLGCGRANAELGAGSEQFADGLAAMLVEYCGWR